MSAVGYKLDVSLTNDFSSFVDDYHAKDIAGTQVNITGLQAGTQYFARVRAVNASGESANSDLRSITTSSVNRDTQLSISAPSFTNSPTATISVTISGGSGTKGVKFYHKGILASGFNEIVLASPYTTTINPSMLDDLGLEFYFTASDEVTTSPLETSHNFIYKSIDAASGSGIPFSSNLDGTSATYEMFSIPYQLDKDDIATVFKDLGGYDKTQWRLFHYQNEKTVEYQNGVNDIETGKGYWFNTIEKADIKPGQAKLSKQIMLSPIPSCW